MEIFKPGKICSVHVLKIAKHFWSYNIVTMHNRERVLTERLIMKENVNQNMKLATLDTM